MKGLLLAVFTLASCGTTAGNILGTVLTLGIGSAPGHHITQTYYLGVLDPLEQLPPMLYRITLRGVASIVSETRFASGWVRSDLVDSLSGNIGFNAAGDVELSAQNQADRVTLKPGRRFWLFGPEGFREAPAGHRLVVIMGGDPSAFFDAVSDALGELRSASALSQGGLGRQARLLLELMVEVMQEERELEAGHAKEGR